MNPPLPLDTQNSSTATPPHLDLVNGSTFAAELARIRAEARDNVELGAWFESLVVRMAQVTDLGLDLGTSPQSRKCWKWADWPDRETITGLDARHNGADLVAQRPDGTFIAIQCKCYADGREVTKDDVAKFIVTNPLRRDLPDTGFTPPPVFTGRWLVSTTPLNSKAGTEADGHPDFKRLPFQQFENEILESPETVRPVREPKPLQRPAIDNAVKGLRNHGRGQLVMACGTGKTFCSLRIAEEMAGRGNILFAAPSIALASQARREWLRHARNNIEALVVCSDAGAGGRRDEDMRVSEMACAVTTDPEAIRQFLLRVTEAPKVVFSTYQSLPAIVAAQQEGAPEFDIAFADEAHRTTGAAKSAIDSPFHLIHAKTPESGHRVKAAARLYMTATPRVYEEKSKQKAADKGIGVIDMKNPDVFGNEFKRVTFKDAVEAGELSDYRVIILGLHRGQVGGDMSRRLGDLATGNLTIDEMARMLGISLAVNGAAEDAEGRQTRRALPRTLAFAKTIARSKWLAKAMADPQVKGWTTRKTGSTSLKFTAEHLDGGHSSHLRDAALKNLNAADEENPRLISNAKLFTEGVDVPALDAVAFFDPKASQTDIVQAVGRVMRKAPGKEYGHIIVPVVVDPGESVAESLAESGGDFKIIGKVLRALQSHDERLAAEPGRFIQIIDGTGAGLPPPPDDRTDHRHKQTSLQLEDIAPGIYARLIAKSGLAKPAENVAGEIANACRRAGERFFNEALAEPMAEALGQAAPANPTEEREACVTAALVLANCCLMHRRLRSEPGVLDGMMALEDIVAEKDPARLLMLAWKTILRKDYRPVFEPGLAVIQKIDEYHNEPTNQALSSLVTVAKNEADKLATLGYDHAGPLYHKVLSSAKSDGAFYTKNTSALLLAGLALPDGDDPFWRDPQAAAKLKIIDPACGTGTLLMGLLATAKRRAEAAGATAEQTAELHKSLVENGLHGLDINTQAVQMAASNLTFGAASIDYQRLNLHTLRHGPQPDNHGQPAAGALELLREANLADAMAPPPPIGEHIDSGAATEFPPGGFDIVAMNPPFSNNQTRGSKFSPADKKAMQQHELNIADGLRPDERGAVNSNAVGSYFPVIAERLLKKTPGATMAEIVPVAGLVGAGSAAKRRYLAEHFHVERIVTCHVSRGEKHGKSEYPFSANCAINEAILILRRPNSSPPPPPPPPPTDVVVLHRQPFDAAETESLLSAIKTGADLKDWGSRHAIPREKIAAGDWSAVQWHNGELIKAVEHLHGLPNLVPLGGGGWSRQTAATSGKPSSAPRLHDLAPGIPRKSNLAGLSPPPQWRLAANMGGAFGRTFTRTSGRDHSE